jgi:hypothetical protein
MILTQIEQVLPCGFLLFSDGDDGGGEGSFFSGEFEEMEDPFTKDKVKVPKEITSFLGHIRSAERTASAKKTEEKYASLIQELEKTKGDNAEITAKLQEIEDANLSAEEKATKKFQTTIKDLEAAVEKANKKGDEWKQKYEAKLMLTDVYASFDSIPQALCNAEQTADWFMKEGNARPEEVLDENGEGTGRYITVMELSIKDKDEVKQVRGTPEELFAKWVSQPQNRHHITSNARSGGDTAIIHNKKKGGNDEEFLKLPPVERMKIERRNKNA